MTGIRWLSPTQSRRVNTLVKKECCNCDKGNCILLDDGDECVCPQLISYSLLYKWFKIAVLPLDKELYAELFKADDMCGRYYLERFCLRLLSEEEKQWLIRIVQKSELLKSYIPRRGKRV